MSKTQNAKLLAHFKNGKSITTREAHLDLDIASLHRRLTELGEMGYRIMDEWEESPTGARYKRYWLGSAA